MSTETKEETGVIDETLPPVKTEETTHPVMQSYNLPNAHQIEEYKNFLKSYDSFVDEMLNEGTDYGIIPGVDKPSLLKPGAEKLEKLFFLRHKKECILKDVKPDGSFIRYTYRTSIFNKAGQLVGTCEGTCNSHEKKYRSHTVFDNQATEEEKKNGKLEERTSRAGNKYKVYVVEKTDFYDLENTIMKMAQKRSYVGAILEATNSSSRFTADAEDQETGAKDEQDRKKPPQRVSPAMFERVKTQIVELDDVDKLKDYKKKINDSDKYEDEQKKELSKLIDEGIKKIKS